MKIIFRMLSGLFLLAVILISCSPQPSVPQRPLSPTDQVATLLANIHKTDAVKFTQWAEERSTEVEKTQAAEQTVAARTAAVENATSTQIAKVFPSDAESNRARREQMGVVDPVCDRIFTSGPDTHKQVSGEVWVQSYEAENDEEYQTVQPSFDFGVYSELFPGKPVPLEVSQASALVCIVRSTGPGPLCEYTDARFNSSTVIASRQMTRESALVAVVDLTKQTLLGSKTLRGKATCPYSADVITYQAVGDFEGDPVDPAEIASFIGEFWKP